MMDKLDVYYIETHIVNHCNLNCAYCTHYAPLAEPWYKGINEYIKEIAKIAEITKQELPFFHILGGEPLLHPQLLDFCYITRKALPLTHIAIVTNGILLPQQSDEFFQKLNEWNIGVYLSDYGLNPRIKEAAAKLNTYTITPKPQFFSANLNFHGVNTIEENFIDCHNASHSYCINLRDGYLYQCPFAAYADIFLNYFNISLGDYKVTDGGINIFTSSIQELNQYFENPIQFCAWCDVKNRRFDLPFHVSERKMSEWLS